MAWPSAPTEASQSACIFAPMGLEFLEERRAGILDLHAVGLELLEIPVGKLGRLGGTGSACLVGSLVKRILGCTVEAVIDALVDDHIVARQPCIDLVVMGQMLPNLAVIAGRTGGDEGLGNAGGQSLRKLGSLDLDRVMPSSLAKVAVAAL